MAADFDIAVIGSGFAGSLMAMIARRLGRSVILLERGKHPRFAIGESSTPLANLLLEELARHYDLPRLLPLTKWGTWQRTYPEIGCGLKRGFTFYHHQPGKFFGDDRERRDQLLVGASPRDEIADTHWYRPDFDHFLVREAQALGAEYLDGVKLNAVSFAGGSAVLEGRRGNQRFGARAGFVIDATGPRGFLHHALNLPEAGFEGLPPTQALYTHFTGVRRMEDLGVCSSTETPPYPVDDAALHHVFDGGWIWVLRFSNGITSAGVAASGALADELRLSEGASGWERLLQRLPTVREQFTGAAVQFPFVCVPKLPFRSEVVAGPNWALLPSAAGFVDPLLSTGFPLTLLGVSRLAKVMEDKWRSTARQTCVSDYATRTMRELDAAAELVAALYASMNDFETFCALSLLYFAAASYSEAARRLDRPELAPGFLLVDHPTFGPGLHSCCRHVREAAANGGLSAQNRGSLKNEIRETIAPFDVAGLSDASRHNWFPVRIDDLFKAAGKLQATEFEIRTMLVRCGLVSP